MPFPPDIFLIGAQKAGTTSLAHLLDQHPQIVLSSPKEPHFFTQNYNKGIEWYKQCFKSDTDRILIDASTSYSMAPIASSGEIVTKESSPLAGIPELIYNLNPNARFIYILRDPVSRTYSSYWHSVRAGEEKRGFRDTLQENSIYMRASNYYYQLEQYLNFFPIESFLFILFEDFCLDPVSVTNQCFKFVGAKPYDYAVKLESAKNKSYTYNKSGKLMTRIIPSKKFLRLLSETIKAVLPDSFQKHLVRLLTKKIPSINKEDKEYLQQYFRNHNDALSKLTGISIEKWQ